MKDQLIKYVDLLFAGTPGSEDIKQEILQNTLDRYDDLVAQGKSPQAAYSLAISGIGDISELLKDTASNIQISSTNHSATPQSYSTDIQGNNDDIEKYKLMQAISTALYILCPVPLFILSDEVGLCLLLVLVAAATALKIMGRSKVKTNSKTAQSNPPHTYTPQQELRRSVRSIIRAVGLACYFLLSFVTGAWHLTWLLFPLIAAIQGLVIAIMDLKEAGKNEN